MPLARPAAEGLEPPPFEVDPSRDVLPGDPVTPKHEAVRAPASLPLHEVGEGPGKDLLGGDDPESADGAARDRRSFVRRELLGGGVQLLVGLATALVALALVILAATVQTWDYAVAASICAPPAFVFLAVRWRIWLGQLPYCYRLLTSLGEDAQNLLEDHLQRVESRRTRKTRALEAKKGPGERDPGA